MAGGVANFGRMLREQARAADMWRSRAEGRRIRSAYEAPRASVAWQQALLDSPDVRCGTCGVAETERPLLLVEGGHACVLCVEECAEEPTRHRGGGAWAAAAAVLLAGVFVLLGLVLWMLGVDTSYGPLAMATGAVLVAGACGALAW